MHSNIVYITTVSLLALGTRADWDLWGGTCSTGFGDTTFDSNNAAKGDQGECGGCSLTADPDLDIEFEGGSPCNCDDIISYYPNGGILDMYWKGYDEKIGHCEEVAVSNGVCNEWNYSCAKTNYIWCQSSVCHPTG